MAFLKLLVSLLLLSLVAVGTTTPLEENSLANEILPKDDGVTAVEVPVDEIPGENEEASGEGDAELDEDEEASGEGDEELDEYDTDLSTAISASENKTGSDGLRVLTRTKRRNLNKNKNRKYAFSHKTRRNRNRNNQRRKSGFGK